MDAASPTTEPNRKDKISVGDGDESGNDSDSSVAGGSVQDISKKKSSKIGFRDRKVYCV